MEDLKLKGPGNQPLIFLATGILSLLTLLLPFARYTHNKVVYQMSGLDFFSANMSWAAASTLSR